MIAYHWADLITSVRLFQPSSHGPDVVVVVITILVQSLRYQCNHYGSCVITTVRMQSLRFAVQAMCTPATTPTEGSTATTSTFAPQASPSTGESV